jgi:hypothetical protein
MQVRRLAILPAVWLALAGCTGTSQRAGDQAPPSAGMKRAAEVARAWPGSAEERVWRSGYYPLEPNEWLPKDAFHSGDDKSAYASGHLDLAAALPTAGPEAQVVWDGGAQLSLPLVSAEAVFRSLTENKGPCAGRCAARLSVTAVRPAVRTVRTSRGQARIPVWEFTVAGYTDPFVHPAVAGQQPVRAVPPASPEPVIPDTSGAVWRSTSADGRTLTAMVPAGGCYKALPGEVYETDQVVVLIGHSHLGQPVGTPCPANLTGLPVTFRLSRPLGDRVVLNLSTGAPEALPPGSETAGGDHGGQ